MKKKMRLSFGDITRINKKKMSKYKFKSLKFKYLILIAIAVAIVLVFFFMRNRNDDIVVAPLQLDEKTSIQFLYTDDNSGENIIIKTDQKDYYGVNSSDVYVSITNTRDVAEKAVLLFYFPKPEEGVKDDKLIPRVDTLERYGDSKWNFITFFKENIKINPKLLSIGLKKREAIPQTLAVNTGAEIEIPANQTIYFKSRIKYPEGSQGEFWIETIGTEGGYGLLDPTYFGTTVSADTKPGWYDPFTYRKKFTVPKTKVSGGSNLSNFPVLISHTDPDIRITNFGGKAASGSGEFIFTSSDGTTSIPYEIEKYSSSSGEFIGWVNVTTLSATADTDIYMYYGGAAAGVATNQNKTGTWNSNYAGVWHLGNGTTLSGADSTSNANTCSLTATPIAIVGKVDGGMNLNGTSQYCTFASSISLTNLTFSAWVKRTDTTTRDAIIGHDGFGAWILDNSNTDIYLAQNGGDSSVWTSIGTHTDGWYHMAVNYNNTSGIAEFFLNSISLGPKTNVMDFTIANNSQPERIGLNDLNYFLGSLDEVKISNTDRPVGWIATEYNNQRSPRTFYAIGAEQKINSSTMRYGTTASNDTKPGWYISGSTPWQNRIKITVPSKVVSGGANLSSFPMLLSFTEPDIKTTGFGGKAASGSGEFILTSSDGTTSLPYEIEKYSSSSGEFVGWVNVTTLSATQDTIMYMYYGGAAAGAATNQNKTGTWNSNYALVIHGGNGTTLNIQDSTSNANVGTNQSATATNVAKINGGISCSGTSYFTVAHSTSINLETYTISAWLKNIAGDNGDAIIAKYSGTGNYPYNLTTVSDKVQLQAFDGSGSFTLNAITTIGTSTPLRYVTATRVDGGAVKLYTDGILEDTDTDTITGSTTNTGALGICARSNGTATTSGFFDEIRISSVADGSGQSGVDWMRTEYNNQVSPRTFTIIGRPESMTVSGNSGSEAPGSIKTK